MHEQLVEYIKRRHFKSAEDYLKRELQQSPNDVYLLTQLANTLWNLGKYPEALDYAFKGESLDSSNGLLAFTIGRILWSTNRCEESISRWDTILQADIHALSEKGFGRAWAKSIINDARFYKADCLHCLGRNKEARLLLEEHISNRRSGQESDFTMQEAKRFLRNLQWASDKPTVTGDVGYFNTIQGVRVEKHIKELEKRKQWSKLCDYLRRKCKEFPMEYWLKVKLSEYLYDRGDKSCLRYAEEAYSMAPDDMLVVYDYASALYLNGHYQKAIDAIHVIQAKGIDYIAYSEHGEGMRWAKRLMRDTESLLKKIEA